MAKVDYLIKFDDNGSRGETHDAAFMQTTKLWPMKAKALLRYRQQII